jgi:hypothetical protein
MTKPHTTLSEAVRALIKNLPPHIVGHSSAKLGYSAAIDDVLELVEQHEAQEPKPTDLSKRLRDIAASWASFTFSPISQEDVLAAAAEIERYYGGMLNWKRTAEAQSTLAATQANADQDALLEFFRASVAWSDIAGCEEFSVDDGRKAEARYETALKACIIIDRKIRAASKTTPSSGEDE